MSAEDDLRRLVEELTESERRLTDLERFAADDRKTPEKRRRYAALIDAQKVVVRLRWRAING